MRTREDIERDWCNADAFSDIEVKLTLEVLLDIRELLLNLRCRK